MSSKLIKQTMNVWKHYQSDVMKVWKQYQSDVMKVWKQYQSDVMRVWKQYQSDVMKVWKHYQRDGLVNYLYMAQSKTEMYTLKLTAVLLFSKHQYICN